MEKLIYLLWKPKGQSPSRTRDILLNDCASRLIETGAQKLSMDIDDPESDVPSPAPFHPGEPISALVSIWTETTVDRTRYEQILHSAGFRLAGYLVDGFVYTEYGDNRHSGPRNWPDGQRSPGLVAVTLLERPKRIPYDKWIKRWHGNMSSVSDALQPRQRYVRNVVLKPITPGAPPYDGIVEEVWPSAKHITNPFLFYCADNVWQLIKHLTIMLWTVTRCFNLFRIRTTIMSEYLIKT